MLDAFSHETVLDHSKHSITALYAYSNKLLLVDSQFTLTHYQVSEHKAQDDGKDYLRTLQIIKSFTRSKPVKLHVVKETGMLLVLADSYLSIYSLSDLSLVQKLNSTKGATTFSVRSSANHSSGIPVLSTQVAVCVKRQVLLFEWLDSEFEGERHFDCPDRGKTVEFLADETIVVALTNDFVTIDVKAERVEALQIPLGGSLGTVSTTMGYLGTRAPKTILTKTTDQMLLVKDVQSSFINDRAELQKTRSIGWGSAPEFVGYTYPYLIVVLKTRVEVRNAKLGSLLQVLDIPSVQFLNDGKSLFLATSHKIVRLTALPYGAQVEQLIKGNHLQEALSLLTALDTVLLDDKPALIRRVKSAMAREQLEHGEFDASMDLYGESWTRPSVVVKLLFSEEHMRPDSSESETSDVSDHREDGNTASRSIPASRESLDITTSRTSQKVTETLPIDGDKSATSEAALRSLSTYLARSRRLLARFLSTKPPLNSEEQYFNSWPDNAPLTVDDMDEELGVTDTTLLRVYIINSPGLVGSLIRLANRCDPVVVKDYLAKEDRWKELVDFYYGKKLHREALTLLREKNAISLGIQYLQRLDVEQWSIIKDFAPWVLIESEEPQSVDDNNEKQDSANDTVVDDTEATSAMDIFMEPSRESNSFDRTEVASFLTSVDKRFGIQFLEFIIVNCGDLTPHFSEDLIYLYIDTTQIASLAKFLESSANAASASRVYNHIPHTSDFDEIRALVLAMLGNLDKAFDLMVTKVRDPQKSEAFATKQFANNPKSYEILLAKYLSSVKAGSSQVYVEEALDLLERHGPRLDADEVLASVPANTSLSSLSSYLKARLESNLLVNYSSLIESKMREAALLRIQTEVIHQRQRYWEIGVDRVCAVCHKRLGNSVLTVFPDGGCVHYGCQKRYHTAEVT